MYQTKENSGLSATSQEVIDKIADHYRAIIDLIGEDSQRPGLLKTPQRAAKALYYLTQGYRDTEAGVVGDALFESEGSGMVIVKDIEFYSLCEHHLLPFFGSVSVGYVPDKTILGISKIARIVDLYARRFQVQERFTAQVCEAVQRATGAKGVMVCCQGEHMCMKMRGVEKQDSSTVTFGKLGIFVSDECLRSEFLSRVRI